jgi:UDP-3-O-[3-hydroxymyristoyl] glucosamine N-acyltransferase
MHVQELARRLGASVDPDADLDVRGVATIEEAGPEHVTFVSNPKYVARARETRAGAILVAPDFAEPTPAVLLRLANPYLAFARALEIFHPPPRPPTGVHRTAVLGKAAVLGKDVAIGAYAVVGDRVRIGDGAVLHPHVVVYDDAVVGAGSVLHSGSVVREGVRLGERVILQNGVVVGADGFGFAPAGDGRWHKIPQVGTVVIGDDVEIQANACIDRAALGATTVGRGTKVDNLVQVGHGCRIGEDTLLCGQVGLAGSTEVGDRVTLAGQVGVAGHLRIGDDVMVAATAGVTESLPDKGHYSGAPAMPLRDHAVLIALFRKLPELSKRLKEVERRLGEVRPGS